MPNRNKTKHELGAWSRINLCIKFSYSFKQPVYSRIHVPYDIALFSACGYYIVTTRWVIMIILPSPHKLFHLHQDYYICVLLYCIKLTSCTAIWLNIGLSKETSFDMSTVVKLSNPHCCVDEFIIICQNTDAIGIYESGRCSMFPVAYVIWYG